MAQQVNNPPAMQETEETRVQSLGQEDSLEEGIGNPLQYFCLENAHGLWSLAGYSPKVTKSQAWLRDLSMHAHIKQPNENQKTQSYFIKIRPNTYRDSCILFKNSHTE